LLLLRVIFSWVRIGDNFLNRFVYEVTEPLLGGIRRIIPPRPSFPLDFSPVIAFVVLQLLQSLINRIILSI
jgi:YggT family protein